MYGHGLVDICIVCTFAVLNIHKIFELDSNAMWVLLFLYLHVYNKCLRGKKLMVDFVKFQI